MLWALSTQSALRKAVDLKIIKKFDKYCKSKHSDKRTTFTVSRENTGSVWNELKQQMHGPGIYIINKLMSIVGLHYPWHSFHNNYCHLFPVNKSTKHGLNKCCGGLHK